MRTSWVQIGLVIAAVLWPAVLAAALVDRFDGRPSIWGTATYLAASRVCHQRPERSFHTHGHQWPVCARCAGLYLAAPIGAGLTAWGSVRRRVRRETVLRGLAVAAALVAATWGFEAVGGDVSGMARAVTAAPLGIAITFAIGTVVARRDETIG